MRLPRLSTRRGRAAAAVALAASALALTGAHDTPDERDEWYDNYHRARQAIDRSDWETAITELETAIQLRERSSRNARTYGVRFDRYFPYYFLGVAHFGAGSDDAALAALRRELDEGEIQRNESFAERIRVLMAAMSAGAADRSAQTRIEDDVNGAMAEALRLRQQGSLLAAMETIESVLAVDPDHAAARAALRGVQMGALQEELSNFEVATRSTAAESGGPQSEAEAVSVLESKALEIFRRGVALMSEGNLEGALARFDLTLVFLEDEGWASRQLYREASEHKELVATEVRRARDSELRARMAAEAGSPATPPEIMLISPANVDEPVGTEIVRIQGVAHDNHGIDDIAVIVNGVEWGTAEVGARRRDIRVSARPQGGSGQGLGTFAQFSKDLVLTETQNRIVVRATNVSGQQTELAVEIRVEADESRIFAAIIGVGEYRDPGIPDLQHAVADAQAFREYVQNDLSVPDDQVFVLLNEQATFGAMKSLFRTELRRQARPNDQVIIYFAGHGAPDEFSDGGDGDGVEKYFLPHDADARDIAATGYPMQDVAESLGQLEAGRVVYLADACFSGASGGRTFGRGATINDGFLGRLSGASPGRVIISASSANEPSLESDALGHGVFTYFLLDGLRGGADADGHRVITVPEVFSYVSRLVPENTGRRQHPTMSGSLGGEMILGRVSGGFPTRGQ